jgi:hypothetical protein
MPWLCLAQRSSITNRSADEIQQQHQAIINVCLDHFYPDARLTLDYVLGVISTIAHPAQPNCITKGLVSTHFFVDNSAEPPSSLEYRK